jgi:hypothetical protein
LDSAWIGVTDSGFFFGGYNPRFGPPLSDRVEKFCDAGAFKGTEPPRRNSSDGSAKWLTVSPFKSTMSPSESS